MEINEVIEIKGLNQRQARICEDLWSCQTEEDLHSYINSLPIRLRKEAEVLKEMMLLTVIDQQVETYDDCAEARMLLKKCIKGN